MPVPFIDLRRFEPDFLERWAVLCAEITANTQFVSGPQVESLESTLVSANGVGGAVACANGTDALQLALRAAGVERDDRVLIPDATFWATFEAVVNVGGRPITVDIDPTDLQMDFDLFCRAVEAYEPKAAILVHLYGWGSTRLEDFRAYCRERELPLIEDGAQTYGTTWQGESIYRDALLATISFYPAKVLGACGDAGAVLCATPELAATVRCLGNHGRTGHYEHGIVGWNSRMDGFSAAYLRLSLDYLPERLASRQRSAEFYRQRLPALGVRVAGPPPGYEENGYLNVTLHDPVIRPALEAALREQGIGFGIVYPGAMSKQPGAAASLAGSVGGTQADKLASSVLNLPLFAYMRDDELEEVLAVLKIALTEATGESKDARQAIV